MDILDRVKLTLRILLIQFRVLVLGGYLYQSQFLLIVELTEGGISPGLKSSWRMSIYPSSMWSWLRMLSALA
jgi:hypothetical protein